MEQFKIKQDGFKEIKKAILIKSLPILILSAIAGIVMSYFNASPDDVYFLPFVLPFLIPLVAGALLFGITKGLDRQKELFESYLITFDNDCIIREQLNTSTITISNAEITEIIKKKNGSYSIKGNSNIHVIEVPAQLLDIERFEKLLTEIKPISERNNESILKKYSGMLSLITIALMVAVYISNNKIVVGISGILLLAIMAYSFIAIRRNKNIDNKTKQGSWWVLLVVTSIIAIMYFKLTS
jgi:hypothetical protein